MMRPKVFSCMARCTAFLPLFFIPLTPGASSAFDVFAEIPGLCHGLSTDERFKEAIIVRGVSEMLSRTFNPRTGDVTRADVPVEPVMIVKDFDECTPILYRALFRGQRLQEVRISFVTSGEQRNVVFQISLRNVVVVGQKISGQNGNSDFPMEQVSFAFEAMRITDVPQNPDGSLGAPVSVECNFTRDTC